MIKVKNKTAVEIHRLLNGLQPILIGMLIAIIGYNAVTTNNIYNTALAFIGGFLLAAYIYQERINKLHHILDELMDAQKGTVEAMGNLLNRLRDEGLAVEIETNDPSLKELSHISKLKGDKDDKAIN